MEKLVILLGLSLIFAFFSCDKTQDECLQSIIDKEVVENDQTICEYEFRDEVLYVVSVSSTIFDGQSPVYSKGDCTIKGYLGGFAGNTMIDSVDFYDHSTKLRQVYP